MAGRRHGSLCLLKKLSDEGGEKEGYIRKALVPRTLDIAHTGALERFLFVRTRVYCNAICGISALLRLYFVIDSSVSLCVFISDPNKFCTPREIPILADIRKLWVFLPK